MNNENKKPVYPNRSDIMKILSIGGLAGLLAACAPQAIRAITQDSPTAITSPDKLSTETATKPAPTDVIPGFRNKHETRGIDGKLQYVTDINGNRIKSSYEIVVPPATDSDWNALNSRLGNGLAVAWDGANPNGTISGVEGLYFNKKGEVGLDLGNDAEVFHLDNVKTQTIDGKQTILVAGYAWNAEAKKWDVFNPGFPMESPKDELGWFTQEDIANGNWLRWHQRATEKTDWKTLFANAYKIDSWVATEYKADWGKDGFFHDNALQWGLKDPNEIHKILNFGINKDQHPGRGGLSYAYQVDAGVAIISLDVCNGDGSQTSLPTIMDDILWTQDRNTVLFTRAALAADREWDSSMVKVPNFGSLKQNIPNAWLFWAIVSYYPDSTISPASLGTKDLKIIQNPEGIAIREATIKGDKIEESAGLIPWGSYVKVNPPPDS